MADEAMVVDWGKAAHEFFGNLPHPNAPSIKVADYPTAARLTAATKYSSQITPKEVEAFWQEFNALNQGLGDRAMSPDQYTQALDKIAPLSWVYHGRPPSMAEIGQMHDAAPDKVRSYYYDLPDKNYPDVPAGEMVKALQAAKPWAQQSLQRDPLKIEARYLYHANLVGNPTGISAHYQMLAQPMPGQMSLTPRLEGTVPEGGFQWGQGPSGSGHGPTPLIDRIAGAPPPVSGGGRTPPTYGTPPPQSGGQGTGATE